MTDDLVKRLRYLAKDIDAYESKAMTSAADRIEALEKALREILSNNPIRGGEGSASIKDIVDAIIRSSTIARAALGEKKDG
jgi:hypothetical protein